MRSRERARSEPLLALALLLSGWVGARALAWNLSADPVALAAQPALGDHPAAAGTAAAPPFASAAPAGRTAGLGVATTAGPPLAPAWTREPLAPVVLAPVVPATVAPPPEVRPAAGPAMTYAPPPVTGGERRIAIAGGHQLLWLAAAAFLPSPPEVAARYAPRSPQPATAGSRWSGDAWLFLRGGGPNPATFPRLSGGGTYGASQAGAVLRYRLAPADPHRLTGYLRAAGALNGTREQELGAGLSARLLPGLPVAAMAELRATRTARGTALRPAAALVTELPPQALPLGFVGEVYAQAGYVGGRDATAFVDGLMRAERPLVAGPSLVARAGAGAWGARQRGAARLDVGPVASVIVRLGDTASARVEADWRFRVAGKAQPGSGPALTVSTGF